MRFVDGFVLPVPRKNLLETGEVLETPGSQRYSQPSHQPRSAA
jgi:hypothetical protein